MLLDHFRKGSSLGHWGWGRAKVHFTNQIFALDSAFIKTQILFSSYQLKVFSCVGVSCLVLILWLST